MKITVSVRSITRKLCAVALGLGVLTSLQTAAQSAVVYQANVSAGERFNPGDTSVITFSTAFISLTGFQNAIEITDLQYGIRRISTGGVLTAVDLELYVAPMTWDGANYGIGTPISVGTTTLAALTSATITQVVNVTYPTPPRPNILLETQSQAGFGGLYTGVRFFGANGTNQNNGWRNVTAPTVGTSLNAYFSYDTDTSVLSAPLSFSANTPPQDRFYSTVGGNVLVVPEPATIVLSGLGLIGLVGLRIRRGR